MEWRAHTFNGKSVLERGRTTLLGSGKKPRNFVAARDVAQLAVIALLVASPLQRVLEVGGPGNFSNDPVAQLYARCAAIEPRIGHILAALVKVIGWIARPVHSGLSRVMRLSSLPDDACPESFDPANLMREYPST